MRQSAIRAGDEWCPSPTGRGVVQCWFMRSENSIGHTRARAYCSRRRVVVEVIGGGVPYGTRQADRCPRGATGGGLVNGIRGLAVVEYDLDGKHPLKALIRKTLEGSGVPLRAEGRNVSARNGEGSTFEGNGTYLSISPVDFD